VDKGLVGDENENKLPLFMKVLDIVILVFKNNKLKTLEV